MTTTRKLVEAGVGVLVGFIVALLVQQFINDHDAANETFEDGTLAGTIGDFVVPLYLLGVLAAAVFAALMK